MAEIPSAIFPKSSLSEIRTAVYLQVWRGMHFHFSLEPLSLVLGTALSALEIRMYIKSPPSPARDPSPPYIGPLNPLSDQSKDRSSRALRFAGSRDFLLHWFLAPDQFVAPSQLALDPMASVGSSSNPQTVEERLADIQQSLDVLKLKTEDQGNLIKAKADEGFNHWKNFSTELRSLKNDLKDSKGEMNYYKDVVFSQFKDAANVTSDFGNRITALESAVNKIMEKFK